MGAGGNFGNDAAIGGMLRFLAGQLVPQNLPIRRD